MQAGSNNNKEEQNTTKNIGESLEHVIKIKSIIPEEEAATRAKVCPHCNGRGYVYIGDEGDVDLCECAKKRNAVKGMRNAGLPKRFEMSSIDTYIPKNDAQAKAKSIAKDYCNSYKTVRQRDCNGLIFVGKPGCGKSHLAAGVMKRVIRDYGEACAFMSSVQLFESLRPHADDNGEDIDTQREALTTAGLLVIDDLGTEKLTEWVEEQLYYVINGRYNAMLPTVITTNLRLADIMQRYGARIVSRLCGMCYPLEVE